MSVAAAEGHRERRRRRTRGQSETSVRTPERQTVAAAASPINEAAASRPYRPARACPRHRELRVSERSPPRASGEAPEGGGGEGACSYLTQARARGTAAGRTYRTGTGPLVGGGGGAMPEEAAPRFSGRDRTPPMKMDARSFDLKVSARGNRVFVGRKPQARLNLNSPLYLSSMS